MELSRLIELLAARQSPQARLESDQPVQIWTPEGWKEGNTPIPGQQVARMISLVAPAHVRAFIHDLNARYTFDFAHPSGTFRVDVDVVAGRRRVWVTRLDANGQPLRPREDSLHGLDFNGAATSTQATSSAPFPGGFDSMGAAPDSGGEEASWYYAHEGQSMGPHSFEQMKSLVTSGALPRETMVFHPSAGDWQQAKLSALGAYFPFERAAEWVNPAMQNWQPPTQNEIRAEKILVRSVSIGGVGLVVLLVGWIGLAQMRGANRAFDYSKQAVVAAEQLSPQIPDGQLHNIHLVRDEDDPTLYRGTGQYRNNYLADVRVEIEKRDFWAQPRVWQLSQMPHDFTGELQSLIMSRINSRLAKAEVEARVIRITLSKDQNNTFSGTVYFDDKTAYPVSAEILQFDSDGTLQRWSHRVRID